jgi:hypothetical protein
MLLLYTKRRRQSTIFSKEKEAALWENAAIALIADPFASVYLAGLSGAGEQESWPLPKGQNVFSFGLTPKKGGN